MKKTTLFIDTSQKNTIQIGLKAGSSRENITVDSKFLRSQALLPSIETFLEMHKKSLSEITDIIVHTGPGSFTGLRVGMTVAQTIAFLFQIPVNDNISGVVNLKYQESPW